MTARDRLCERWDVLVIGAGVSGCACAAVLAEAGLKVVVMEGALDRAGLPGYGPVVAQSDGVAGFRDLLGSLPVALGRAWGDAAWVLVDGAGFVCVDRRKVSVEGKRALEDMPGLCFRQGLVVGLRLAAELVHDEGRSGGWGVTAQTIFGEEVAADVAVIAVGMGLQRPESDGRRAHADDGGGVRGTEGLVEGLAGLGATFAETAQHVGRRFSQVTVRRVVEDWENGSARLSEGAPIVDVKEAPAADACRELSPQKHVSRARLVPFRTLLGDGTSEMVWPPDYPESPHWVEEADPREVIRLHEGACHAEVELCSDGSVSGELYVLSDGRETIVDGGPASPAEKLFGVHVASRLGESVVGLKVSNLRDDGRLKVGGPAAPSIWVTGRAAGASDYLESLTYGVRTGRAVADAFAGGRLYYGDERNGESCREDDGGGQDRRQVGA